MRTRAVLLATVASFSVLGIGWQVGTHAIEASHSLVVSGSSGSSLDPPGAGGAGNGAGSDSSTSATQAAAGSAARAASGAASMPASQSGTFTGSAVRTRFGNVQVSVTVANGAVIDVTALQLTAADRKSVQISARAEPILRSEVVTAQSAGVQNVSGATYTSNGYRQSAQSALDQAGF